MSASDAKRRPQPAGRRSTWLYGMASILLLAAVAWSARQTVGVQRAEAQAPPAQKSQPAMRQGPQPARPVVVTGAPVKAAGPVAPVIQGNGTPLANAGAPNPNNKLMAVVNGETITREDLGKECVRRYGKDILQSMANRQLIQAACAERKIAVTDKDVNAEIDRMAAKFGLSRDRWVSMLQEERGFTEQQYRQEVVWPMLALRRIAAGEVQVTEEELKTAFETEYGPKVRARLIVVSSKPKADQIRAEAQANPDSFGDLAKTHCEDAALAAALGVIPPVRKHMGDPALESAAFSLKPGQISPVVKVEKQYFILKCEDQIPPQYIASQNLKAAESALVDKIRESKLREASSKFFEERQKTAKIVIFMNDPAKQAQMPGVAATINGQPITLAQLTDECITRHGAEILDGEIHRKLLEQEMKRKSVVVNDTDIDAEIARAAATYGFLTKEGKPDVEKWLNEVSSKDGATVELYVRDAVWPSVALKKIVGNQVPVTDEDLQKGFESNYGTRVEVLAIVMGNQREATKVWEMARNNPTEPFFAQLAEQYSVEPASRANGGKVPPIRKYGGSGILEEEAFKLKAGEVSGVINVVDQFIILRCVGRTKPIKVAFEDVKADIYQDIEEKKLRSLMTREFERMEKTAQIDNFLSGTSQAGTRGKTDATSQVMPAGGKSPAAGGRVAPASANLPQAPPRR